MGRSSKQKINKETAALNNTLDQKDLIDIFTGFHPKIAEYTYFSSAHGMFYRIDTKQITTNLRGLKYQASSLATML